MSDSKRYYDKQVYVCRNCGKEWDTPGSAEICYKEDRITELVEQMDDHKQFALNDIIEQLEQYVENHE